MRIRRPFWQCFVALMVLTFVRYSVTEADVLRWDTGEVIAGTEGIAPGPGDDLTDWNTVDHNLRFGDFEALDLTGALFDRSWLDDAHFIDANLTDALLRDATLTRADLSGADLTNARFSRSVLTDANLSGTVVIGARFGDTTLRTGY